jgi:hypothetical protein
MHKDNQNIEDMSPDSNESVLVDPSGHKSDWWDMRARLRSWDEYQVMHEFLRPSESGDTSKIQRPLP